MQFPTLPASRAHIHIKHLHLPISTATNHGNCKGHIETWCVIKILFVPTVVIASGVTGAILLVVSTLMFFGARGVSKHWRDWQSFLRPGRYFSIESQTQTQNSFLFLIDLCLAICLSSAPDILLFLADSTAFIVTNGRTKERYRRAWCISNSRDMYFGGTRFETGRLNQISWGILLSSSVSPARCLHGTLKTQERFLEQPFQFSVNQPSCLASLSEPNVTAECVAILVCSRLSCFRGLPLYLQAISGNNTSD